MSSPNGTVTNLSGDGSVLKVVWTLTTANYTGSPFPCPEHYHKSVMATGTFGGATVQLTGSNDDTNYYPLNNRAGTAIALTAAGMADCDGVCSSIEPTLSVVGSGATIVVTALLYAKASRFAQRS